MKLGRCSLGIAALLSLPQVSRSAPQQEAEELGWTDKAELAVVLTAGNSEASTFAFRNLLTHVWEDGELSVEAAGLRTETTTVTRIPVGSSADDFVLREDSVSSLTAENYLARAKYDRELSERLFVFGSGGWDRNEFAGIRNRYFGAAGVGNIWYEREGLRWRTDYGVSVTRQLVTAGESSTFAGVRLSSDLERKLTGSTTVTNVTIVDENFDDTSDFRLDSLSAVAVSMAEHLAVKLSLQLLFDNVPSFVEARLISAGTGAPLSIRVPVQADELDTLFKVALVIDF